MTVRFIDPVAQVIIKDHESGAEWHWGAPSHPFLTSLTMTWEGDMVITGIVIGVDMPYDYAMTALDASKTPFKKDNLVRVRIGYASGEWTEWAHGVLAVGGKGLSIGPDGLSGNLEVSHVPMKLSGYTVSKDILKNAGYDVEKLLKLLGEEIGCEVDITSNALSNMNAWKLAEPRRISYKEKANFYAGLEGMSIWQIFRTVCKDNDCSFFIKKYKGEKTIIIHTEKDITSGNLNETDYVNKYVIRGIVDPLNNQYPCFGFTPKSDEAVWLSRIPSSASAGTNGRGIDSETAEDVEYDVRSEDQEDARDGKVENTEPQDIKASDGYEKYIADAFKNDGSLGTFMSAPILPYGTEIFKNQVRKFQRQGDPGMHMEINSIGVPDEMVGNLCQLWGAGVLFNGTFCIEKMVHSWSPGSWEMRLNVYHRGSKAVSGEQKEPAGGQLPK
jgi:hypothetical protein